MLALFAHTLGYSYWILLAILLAGGLVQVPDQGFSEAFHWIAFYLPPIALLAVISGQIDLLYAISRGQQINIQARMYDFIHWFMLVALNIGIWMFGGVTIWWFLLQLPLLAIIAWQIGIAFHRHLRLSYPEWVAGVGAGCFALLLGIGTAAIRYADSSTFGWGWILETITATVATLIVLRWILLDISTIRTTLQGSNTGYPRAFFLKGVFGNSLILVFWFHVMLEGGISNQLWWLKNIGLTFNVLVGNALYLAYWLLYEYYRSKSGKSKQPVTPD
ncbi:MAG: hypothetical protein A3E07_00795 [Candidatus Wildermuthbacteria bacterium RIFCSPHIGHO2_12_FULL_45_9]|uniref:Uncharacterized protein n=1 Tax=Candidatus Wildermuthbacteria bacterium RIFCSPHIGHO2_02_FULL_45_25 TaxID=1802450 RepID=A0A1G2R3T4_9BACT|nr:MAG: hypothetical protein A3C04_03895 [Candidatus Wildermuthbacteria bacterium RIFCSPHIGHO2_02_FULL_45_25]OHA72015.1 MAG: hypothetical protein A3E07_00795 [Candidatus Wildermuthbacteria bacterium RIFCSPHIGHO2_12_FULL_45_9]